MKIKKIIFFAFLVVVFISSAVTVSAVDCSGTSQSGSTELCNPLGSSISTPQAFIGQIIKGVLGIVGSLALVMFIYGGLTWMTSSGNSEQVTKGKNIIIWAVIGLVIIFTSYTLISFLLTDVLKAPGA